jgi:hypothetical protein
VCKVRAQPLALASSSHRPGAQEQNALQLREAITNGSWNPALAGGTLTLSDLQVRTNDVA